MKKLTNKFLFVVLLIILCLVNCSNIPPRPDIVDYEYLKEYISWLIKEKMNEYGITGLSIALVSDNKVIWTDGFGYADKKNKVLASEETIYRIASISKLFTATAIMQLVEQDKIDIDKPVTEYIPEFSFKTRYKDSEPITIRSLMTHHSGLSSDRVKGEFTYNSAEYFDVIIDYLKDDYVPYPVNHILSYSNIGVDVLGVIIERVSGMNFNDYIEKNILEPLGMNKSSFILKKDMEVLSSKAYEKNGKSEPIPFMRSLPAGNLRSSVLDLANFMKMIIGKGTLNDIEILKSETLDKMFIVQNENIPLDFDFKIGLNWFLSRPSLSYVNKVCWHDGDAIYFHSDMVILPEHKLGVVVLTNTKGSEAIIATIVDETLKLALEIEKGIKPTENTSEIIELSEEQMVKYCGDFATPIGIVKIIKEGKELKVQSGGIKLVMFPRKDGWFTLKFYLFGFIPCGIKELDGFKVTVRNVNGKKILIAQKEPKIPIMGIEYTKKEIPEIWKNRVGKYKIINFDEKEEYKVLENPELVYKDGILSFHATVNLFGTEISPILEPISDNELVVVGIGRLMMETIKVKNIDGEEIIEYSGYLLKKEKGSEKENKD